MSFLLGEEKHGSRMAHCHGCSATGKRTTSSRHAPASRITWLQQATLLTCGEALRQQPVTIRDLTSLRIHLSLEQFHPIPIPFAPKPFRRVDVPQMRFTPLPHGTTLAPSHFLLEALAISAGMLSADPMWSTWTSLCSKAFRCVKE